MARRPMDSNETANSLAPERGGSLGDHPYGSGPLGPAWRSRRSRALGAGSLIAAAAATRL